MIYTTKALLLTYRGFASIFGMVCPEFSVEPKTQQVQTKL